MDNQVRLKIVFRFWSCDIPLTDVSLRAFTGFHYRMDEPEAPLAEKRNTNSVSIRRSNALDLRQKRGMPLNVEPRPFFDEDH